MTISRYNYQEFFLLYTDNELDLAGRRTVEDFVQQNPDLEEELFSLQQAILQPDHEVIFENKEGLLEFNNTFNFIHPGNFEEFAIAYTDNELDEQEKERLVEFIKKNPDFQQEFDLIKSLKLSPDTALIYPAREQLYRHEKETAFGILPWWKMAAAAIILSTAGFLWMSKRQPVAIPTDLVQAGEKIPSKNKLPAPLPAENFTAVDTPAKQSPEVIAKTTATSALTGKRNTTVNRKEVARVSIAPEKQTSPAPGKRRVNAEEINNIAIATDKQQQLPKSSSLNTNSQVQNGNSTATLASLDASIDSKNRMIPVKASLVVNTINRNDYNTVTTVADTEDEDNVSVAGIPLDKKNPLRGILRKATRFIDKNTASRTSKKSGLLIGNIEIAFQ